MSVGDLEADGPAEARRAQLYLEGLPRGPRPRLRRGSRSSLRVTRKDWCSTTSMPGNSVSRWAAMTSSRGMKRGRRRGAATKRGSRCGTLSRANGASPLRVARRERPDSARGRRCRGTDGRVDRQRASGPGRCAPRRPRRGSCGRRRRARPDAKDDPDRAQRRHDLVDEDAQGPLVERVDPSRMSSSCSGGGAPVGGVVAVTPAATWSFRPATRTWKNSSRFWLKMARNLARSSRARAGRQPARGRGR